MTDAAANCTGTPTCKQSTSGCRGTADDASSTGRQLEESDALASSNLGCAPGLTGLFCQLCDRESATGPIYYVPASELAVATCEPCADMLGGIVATAAGVACAIGAVAMLLYGIHERCLSAQHKKQLERAWATFNLGVKLKVGALDRQAFAASAVSAQSKGSFDRASARC